MSFVYVSLCLWSISLLFVHAGRHGCHCVVMQKLMLLLSECVHHECISMFVCIVYACVLYICCYACIISSLCVVVASCVVVG